MDTTTTVLDVIVDIAVPIVTACVPVLTWKLFQIAGLKASSDQKAIVDTAIERGVGTALAHGQLVGDALLTDPTNRNNALVKANQYVMTHAGDELDKLQLGSVEIAPKVAAELALKLNESVPAVLPDVVKIS